MTKDQFEARFSWIVENDCWIKPIGNSLSTRPGSKKIRASLRAHENNGDRKTIDLDRLAYEVFIGQVPKSQFLEHVCGNIDCFNPDHVKIIARSPHKMYKTKICSRCGKDLSFLEFDFRSDPKMGRKSKCKQCEEDTKIENRERIIETKRRKNEEKIERRKAREAKRLLPKPIPKKALPHERTAAWRKSFENNPITRIKHAHRRRVNNLIKIGFMAKEKPHTRELFGCTYEEYRKHIEEQFRDGMTWHNHGSIWEIDHIRPLASFNLLDEDEQLIAFNYKNVQPLLVKENRYKRDKWDGTTPMSGPPTS